MKNKGSRALSHKEQGAALKRDDSEMTLKIRPAGRIFLFIQLKYLEFDDSCQHLFSLHYLYTPLPILIPDFIPVIVSLNMRRYFTRALRPAARAALSKTHARRSFGFSLALRVVPHIHDSLRIGGTQ